jgi:hypothetical protein
MIRVIINVHEDTVLNMNIQIKYRRKVSSKIGNFLIFSNKISMQDN